MKNEKLIALFKETNNQNYITELFENNMGLMNKLAREFRCDIDICYMGFTKALNKFDESKGNFTTLLYHTIKNEHYMECRKKVVETISIDTPITEDLTLEDTISSDEDFESGILNVDLLYKLLDCLTERQKQVVVLKHIQGYSQKEIARILGLSVQSVANTLTKAMKKLTKYASGVLYE